MTVELPKTKATAKKMIESRLNLIAHLEREIEEFKDNEAARTQLESKVTFTKREIEELKAAFSL